MECEKCEEEIKGPYAKVKNNSRGIFGAGANILCHSCYENWQNKDISLLEFLGEEKYYLDKRKEG